MSVINGRTNEVTATIPVGGSPSGSRSTRRPDAVTSIVPVGNEPYGVAVNLVNGAVLPDAAGRRSPPSQSPASW